MPTVNQKPKIYHSKLLEQGQSISIDGCGNDPNWHGAQVLTDFSFPWIARTPPTTEFRAVWDVQQFYFRFNVADSDVVLGAGADAMQKVIGSDRAEIFFSTGPDLNPYFGLEIDPRGNVLDYEGRFHRQIDWNWTCDGLVVATSLTDIGYVVEGLIPLATFRKLGCLHRDDSGEYLHAGLYRAEFSHDPGDGPVIEDWISWVDPQVTTPDFHVPTSFGTIRLSE